MVEPTLPSESAKGVKRTLPASEESVSTDDDSDDDNLFIPDVHLLPPVTSTPRSSTDSHIDWAPWKERLLAIHGDKEALTHLIQEIQLIYEKLSISQIRHLAYARLSEWRRHAAILPSSKSFTISWKFFPGIVESITTDPSSISSWVTRIQDIYPLSRETIIHRIYAYLHLQQRRPPSSFSSKCTWEPYKEALLNATSDEEIFKICTDNAIDPSATRKVMLKRAHQRIYDWKKSKQALPTFDDAAYWSTLNMSESVDKTPSDS